MSGSGVFGASGPAFDLQLSPLSEEVPARAVSEPELGPEAIERDLGQGRRMTSWAQALHRGFGVGDRPGGIVGREADELGIDARGEVAVLGRSGQGRLEELPRAARPADPRDLRQEVQRLRSECCHRRARLALRDGPRALDVSGRQQRRSLPQRTPGQLLQPPIGVSRPAASNSSAAACGAPRFAACVPACSSSAATASSGVLVLNARWRARSSRSPTTVARRSCTSRRRWTEAEP